LSWKNDTSKFTSFFIQQINALVENNNSGFIFNSLQPKYADYWKLRNSMKTFLKNKDTTNFVFIDPSLLKGNLEDSISFYNALFSRLVQDSITDTSLHKNELPDSTVLSNAIKLWQEKHLLTTNGLLNSELLKQINLTDNRKYARLIVTLDRFKQLPDSIQQTFILVNLPAYQLNFWDDDTVVISSKVICGKPLTPTPVLKSAVREVVTYPTWTVPNSIIKKEMLPQLKKNPAYLSKKGLGLYNHKGKKVDPSTVDWTKFNKGIPYKIRQKSGERNALGAIKFNFDNNFDVYLHDTNERYLFQRKRRCLSHGCVRVEQWKNLALAIARYDSLKAKGQFKLKYNSDSIINWIANNEHHRIKINQPIPIIIAYLTCDAENGKLIFHDDMYSDDDRLIKRYFSTFNN
jgi:murein L,D-transpeptidase YcbB/YkuD